MMCRNCLTAELDPDDVFYSDVEYCDPCSEMLAMKYHEDHGPDPSPSTLRCCTVCRTLNVPWTLPRNDEDGDDRSRREWLIEVDVHQSIPANSSALPDPERRGEVIGRELIDPQSGDTIHPTPDNGEGRRWAQTADQACRGWLRGVYDPESPWNRRPTNPVLRNLRTQQSIPLDELTLGLARLNLPIDAPDIQAMIRDGGRAC